MDIRSAQKMALDIEPVKGSWDGDTTVEFGLLAERAASVLDAWKSGSREISDELGIIAVSLLRLAQSAGTDLQEVVEAKLAPSRLRVDERRGKLVRDKIPQIIRSKGQEPVITTVGVEDYRVRLREKLREEVEEYLASDNDSEELADILEVMYALAREAGTDQQELERLRAAKAEKRGGFADRIVWFCNEPQ